MIGWRRKRLNFFSHFIIEKKKKFGTAKKRNVNVTKNLWKLSQTRGVRRASLLLTSGGEECSINMATSSPRRHLVLRRRSTDGSVVLSLTEDGGKGDGSQASLELHFQLTGGGGVGDGWREGREDGKGGTAR